MIEAMQIFGIIKFCLPIILGLCLIMSIVLLFRSLENDKEELFCSPVVSFAGIILTLSVSTIPGGATQVLGLLFAGFIVMFVFSLWITLYLAVNR